MHATMPTVHLVASPAIRWTPIRTYLESIGGLRWYDRVAKQFIAHEISDAEALVEFMARGCYKSFDADINPNVTKVREDSAAYFENILKSGHGSVLEHGMFSFYFADVSRVFTHELVRHRAGVAISQESLRYVRLTDLGFRIPAILEPMTERILSIVETLEEFQRDAAEEFGLDDEGVPFHYKKEVTSALRRLAPIGLSTNIGWSANLRTLRFCIEKRTEAGAEEEIRIVFNTVGEVMQKECPMLFSDYRKVPVEGSDVPAWETDYAKV